MRNHRNDSMEDVDRYRDLFLTTLDKCYLVFGENTFIDTTKSKPKQSLVYYDLLMKDFSNREQGFLVENKDRIKELFVEYCLDSRVKRTVSGGTLLKSKILIRSKIWEFLMDTL